MITPRETRSLEQPPPDMLGSEFGTTPDTKPGARLNAIGIWWIIYGAVWTAMVVAGMIFLFIKRKTPTVRLRGLTLTFSGIVFLHLYWITIQIGYTIGPLAPEAAEFWIMSIWYPFGIALFQAGNTQFLHVAKAQARYALPPSQMITKLDEKRAPRKQNWFSKMFRLDQKRSSSRVLREERWWDFFLPNEYQSKMFTLVAIGMAVQLFVVVLIYLISRKFHSSFGIPGTEVHGSTPMEVAMKQGRGWEWWPSLAWQFIWAWIVAPVVIWRSRGIHDTHGWQLQTIVCCVAGLHAAPMWLIALYVPGMAPVNSYFIPPQWIGLSISVIEIFTIFVPCYQVRKDAILFKEALATREEWEKRHPHNGFKFNYDAKSSSGASSTTFNTNIPRTPSSPGSTKVGSDSTVSFADPWKNALGLESGSGPGLDGYDLTEFINDDSILTKTALDLVLAKNPEPLRQFSARRDFSGENIAFLTAVSDWKASLPPSFVRTDSNPAAAAPPVDPETIRHIYTKALGIYTEFISNRDAEFPINIGFEIRRALEGVFERAARKLLGDMQDHVNSNPTPFFEATSAHHHPRTGSFSKQARRTDSRGSEAGIMTSVSTTEVDDIELGEDGAASGNNDNNTTTYQGDIPPSFDANVFEKAYDDIRYLVLTNTWPKYVREWRNGSDAGSIASSDGGREGGMMALGGGDSSNASSAGGGRRIKNKSLKRSATASAATISEKGSSWSFKGGISRALGIKA